MPLAAKLYPWFTSMLLMYLDRRSSIPPKGTRICTATGNHFWKWTLLRYYHIKFRSCVQEIVRQNKMILACLVLTQNMDIEDLHVNRTFKVILARIGYLMLTIHVMIQNYASLFFLKIKYIQLFKCKNLTCNHYHL